MRPALGNVLARLLDVRPSDNTASLVRCADRIDVTDEDVRIDSLPDAFGWRPRWRTIQERRAIDGRNDDGSTRYAVTPAHRISVEEAEEELAECGLWPAAWLTDENAPRWWCEACDGTGWATSVRRGVIFQNACSARGAYADEYSGEMVAGHARTANSLPSFVAVASIGVETVLFAAEMARILARDPVALIVWRTMTRASIDDHHRAEAANSRHISPDELTTAQLYSREWRLWRDYPCEVSWNHWCPYGKEHEQDWRPMREMSFGRGKKPMSTGISMLRLKKLDGNGRGEIVLGVELIEP